MASTALKTDERTADNKPQWDPQLATPAHDALMLWLDQEVDRLCTPVEWEIVPVWRRLCDKELVERKCEQLRASGWYTTHLAMRPAVITAKTWEKPILNGANKYLIGFADMHVVCRTPYIAVHPVVESEYTPATDAHPDVEWQWHNELYFEVKPVIPSLGELLRQVQRYRAYANATWCVVSPDTRFQAQIQDQGIRFVAAPPAEEIMHLLRQP